jgi:hypothetical protein
VYLRKINAYFFSKRKKTRAGICSVFERRKTIVDGLPNGAFGRSNYMLHCTQWRPRASFSSCLNLKKAIQEPILLLLILLGLFTSEVKKFILKTRHAISCTVAFHNASVVKIYNAMSQSYDF